MNGYARLEYALGTFRQVDPPPPPPPTPPPAAFSFHSLPDRSSMIVSYAGQFVEWGRPKMSRVALKSSGIQWEMVARINIVCGWTYLEVNVGQGSSHNSQFPKTYTIHNKWSSKPKFQTTAYCPHILHMLIKYDAKTLNIELNFRRRNQWRQGHTWEISFPRRTPRPASSAVHRPVRVQMVCADLGINLYFRHEMVIHNSLVVQWQQKATVQMLHA